MSLNFQNTLCCLARRDDGEIKYVLTDKALNDNEQFSPCDFRMRSSF